MAGEPEAPELLPCPCCQSPAGFMKAEGEGEYVMCTNLQCRIMTPLYSSQGDVRPFLTNIWNRRPE